MAVERHYRCRDCNQEFDMMQSIKEDVLTWCDFCHGSLDCVPQPFNVIDLTPKTLGGLAESNTRKMGTYGIQEKRYKDKKEYFDQRVAAEASFARRMGKEPPKREFNPEAKPVDTSIARWTPEQKADYIATGKTPK
jgi:DNA-directed RNA polymerase subunit RPC12/RpoP